MENIKVCKNCGSLENAGAERCSKCNTYIGDYGNENLNQNIQQQQYVKNITPQQSQPIVIQNSIQDSKNEPLSVGRYMLLFILGCFPIINLICWIVWLVDSSTNRNIKNFIKAQLILFLIVLFIGIVGVAIFGVGLGMLF